MNMQNPLWRFTGVRPTAWLFFAFLYVPILVLVVLSFNGGQSATIWESFSLKWYRVVANDPEIVRAAKNSLIVATFATLISTALATLAALGMRGRAFHGQTLMSGVLGLPLLVPEIVTGIALLIFFAMIKVWTGYTGLGYLVAAHTAFCIPFAYLPIRARLENMDLTLERAAADLYATPWMTFRRVTLPLMWSGIIAGFMLAFVVSLDDVVITELVKSGGQDTLPTYMLGQLRRVVTPEINAISSVFLLISIAIVTLFFFLNRRQA